jgi:hypothetical protein
VTHTLSFGEPEGAVPQASRHRVFFPTARGDGSAKEEEKKKRKSKRSESRNYVDEIRTREAARRYFVLLVVGLFVGFVLLFGWTVRLRRPHTENTFDGSRTRNHRTKVTVVFILLFSLF